MRHPTVLTLLLLGLSQATAAQTPVERFERRAEQLRRDESLRPESAGLDERALFDYGGYFSLDYFSIDDNRDDTHVLRQYELIGYARLNIDQAQEVFVRAHTGYRDFNDRDSFDGRGDEVIDGDLERGYYRLDMARPRAAAGRSASDGRSSLVLELGRDVSYWGNGLVLAEVLDGGSITLSGGDLRLDLLAGITPTRTLDIDPTRPKFEYNTRRGFYGAMLSKASGAHRPFVYVLAQRDYNQDDFARISGIDTRFNYDSWYLGFGSQGALGDRAVYGAEFVFEGGHGLSNSFENAPGSLPAQIPQTSERIGAFAGDLRLDYLPTDARRSRFSFELVFASGDPDRLATSNTFGGNRTGTSDRAFNAFGAINTGLAFAPAVSNLICLRGGFSTFPFTTGGAWRRLQVGADFFAFAKFTENAPIDEPTLNGHYLGVEPDLFANWQLTSDLTLAVRYGVFFPGHNVASDDTRQFIFVGLTYGF